MSEPLTREQVAERLHLLYLAKAHEMGWPVRHECDVPYDRLTPDGQALDLMFADWHLAQIAALRQQLATAERELVVWEQSADRHREEHACLKPQLETAKQQLASLARVYTNTVAMLKRTNQDLESQRASTYQAVEREHTAKRQLAELTEQLAARDAMIDTLTTERNRAVAAHIMLRAQATAAPDTPSVPGAGCLDPPARRST
jgi:septal ring factor EnvC (AmiA/AmiB activator)